MNAPDLSEVLKQQAARRRELEELEETQKWVHHAADLKTGRVRSSSLARPIAALSRQRRLANLGHVLDTSIFGGPGHRLTTREPFVASPAASLVALNASSYSAELNRINWFPPRDFSAEGFFGGMTFLFFDPPERRMLLTLSLQARAHDGMTGHVLISSFDTEGRARFPITDTLATHTFDVIFAPFAGRRLGIILTIQEGIAHLAFISATLREEPPVLDPG
jgi:hypothetical protein